MNRMARIVLNPNQTERTPVPVQPYSCAGHTGNYERVTYSPDASLSDLHNHNTKVRPPLYTHFVLELFKKHNICPLFIPAGCTDIMQECDVVVNKPFKNALRKGFRDHMDDLFRIHREKGLPLTEFSPKLTMGALKPFLKSFVQKGIQALKTPEMKTCIQNLFASDGCFTIMWSDEVQHPLRLVVAEFDQDLFAIMDDEIDEIIEELGLVTDTDVDDELTSDSDNDSD